MLLLTYYAQNFAGIIGQGLVITFSYLVQNLVQVIDNLVTENAELQQQLTRKEAELTRAVETARREQQQVRQCACKGTPLGFSPQHFIQLCTCRLCALYSRLLSSSIYRSYINSYNPVRERRRCTDNS